MSKSKTKKRSKANRVRPRARPQVQEVNFSYLKAIIERVKNGVLSEGDVDQLEAAVDTLAFLTQELEKKGVSIQRLRRLIFGSSSEKTRDVFSDDDKDKAENDSANGDSNNREEQKDNSAQEKPKRKGHGRRAAEQYHGAEKIKVGHQNLKSGDACPACERGKLYQQSEPAKLVRVTGMAPLVAKIYELDVHYDIEERT